MSVCAPRKVIDATDACLQPACTRSDLLIGFYSQFGLYVLVKSLTSSLLSPVSPAQISPPLALPTPNTVYVSPLLSRSRPQPSSHNLTAPQLTPSASAIPIRSHPGISSTYSAVQISPLKQSSLDFSSSSLASRDESILGTSLSRHQPYHNSYNLGATSSSNPNNNTTLLNNHFPQHPSHQHPALSFSSSSSISHAPNPMASTSGPPPPIISTTKKRGFFTKLRKKASRGDLAHDESAFATPPYPFLDDAGQPSSKLKNVAGVMDDDHSSGFPPPPLPPSSTASSKKQLIRKLTGGAAIVGHKDKSSKHPSHEAHPSNGHPPQNHHSGAGPDGDLITLDTNLDEMDGIIDPDHLLRRQRRESSLSATFSINNALNSTSSPPHAAGLTMESPLSGDVSGATLFADPFNPGRTIGGHGPAYGRAEHERQILDATRSRNKPGSAGSSSTQMLNRSFGASNPIGPHHQRDGSLASLPGSQYSTPSVTRTPYLADGTSRPSLSGLVGNHSISSPHNPHQHQPQTSPTRKPSNLAYQQTHLPPSHTAPGSIPNIGLGLGMPFSAGSGLSLVGANAPPSGIGAAGWTAPESWAVNPLEGEEEADTDADESEDDEGLLISEFQHGSFDQGDGGGFDGHGMPSRNMPHGQSNASIVSSSSTHSTLNTGSIGTLTIPSRARLGSIDENAPQLSGSSSTPNLNSGAPNSRRPSDTGGMSMHNGSEGSGVSRTLGGLGGMIMGMVGGTMVNGKMGSVARTITSEMTRPVRTFGLSLACLLKEAQERFNSLIWLFLFASGPYESLEPMVPLLLYLARSSTQHLKSVSNSGGSCLIRNHPPVLSSTSKNAVWVRVIFLFLCVVIFLIPFIK